VGKRARRRLATDPPSSPTSCADAQQLEHKTEWILFHYETKKFKLFTATSQDNKPIEVLRNFSEL